MNTNDIGLNLCCRRDVCGAETDQPQQPNTNHPHHRHRHGRTDHQYIESAIGKLSAAAVLITLSGGPNSAREISRSPNISILVAVMMSLWMGLEKKRSPQQKGP